MKNKCHIGYKIKGRKQCEKRRNCLLQAISPFLTMFSTAVCPWARHFRAQPSTDETQESMNNVSCRRHMTEILLKAA